MAELEQQADEIEHVVDRWSAIAGEPAAQLLGDEQRLGTIGLRVCTRRIEPARDRPGPLLELGLRRVPLAAALLDRERTHSYACAHGLIIDARAPPSSPTSAPPGTSPATSSAGSLR